MSKALVNFRLMIVVTIPSLTLLLEPLVTLISKSEALRHVNLMDLLLANFTSFVVLALFAGRDLLVGFRFRRNLGLDYSKVAMFRGIGIFLILVSMIYNIDKSDVEVWCLEHVETPILSLTISCVIIAIYNSLGVSSDFNFVIVFEKALLFVGSIAVLVTPFASSEFRYREAARAVSIWSNPNTFGAICAVCASIAIARLLLHAKQPNIDGLQIYRLGGFITTVGMCTTLSRGAFLAFLISLVALIFLNRSWLISCLYGAIALNKARYIVAIALLVILIGFFLPYKDVIWARIASPFLSYDISSQNRVVAWLGGMRIASHSPVFGVGWSELVSHYYNSFMPLYIWDPNAIHLNGFIKLAASAGIPALIALGCYLVRIFLLCIGNVASRSNDGQVACVALFVLVVFFNFNGGLWGLSLGPLFWILSEHALLVCARRNAPQ